MSLSLTLQLLFESCSVKMCPDIVEMLPKRWNSVIKFEIDRNRKHSLGLSLLEFKFPTQRGLVLEIRKSVAGITTPYGVGLNRGEVEWMLDNWSNASNS